MHACASHVEHVIEWASPLLLVDMFCMPGTEVSEWHCREKYTVAVQMCTVAISMFGGSHC